MSDSRSGYASDLRIPGLVATAAYAMLIGVIVTQPGPATSVILPSEPKPMRIVLPAANPAPFPSRVPEASGYAETPPEVLPPVQDVADNLASTVAPPVPDPVSRAPTRRIGDVEVMGLAYALPTQEDLGKDGLRVKKRLIVSGFGSRIVDIYLHAGSRIEIDGAELVEALVSLGAVSEAQAEVLPLDPGRQSFTAVRDAGLDLGYDAVSDTLVIEPGSAGIARPLAMGPG